MKKITIMILASLCFFPGCIIKRYCEPKGNGNIIKQVRDVSEFDKISIHGAGHLTLIQGDKEGLEIETDENLLTYIKTKVRDRELVIEWEDDLSPCPTQTIQYKVSLKKLSKVTVSGSMTLESEKIAAKDLSVHMNGCGNLVFKKLDADKFSTRMCGACSSNIESGACGDMKIEINGSGNFHGRTFECKKATIEIHGSGYAEINASETLNYGISGSGSVGYVGSPSIHGQRAGSGEIHKL